MQRFAIIFFFATLSFGQTAAAPLPPPEVDKALRTRITRFFDLLVAREYRKAEELVGDEGKEFYYNNEKPRVLKYQITSIKYSDDFTRAEVLVTTTVPPFSAMTPRPMDTTAASVWKLVYGAWFWNPPPAVSVTDLLKQMTGNGAAIPPAMPFGGGAGIAIPQSVQQSAIAVPGGNTNLAPGVTQQELMEMAMTGRAVTPAFKLDKQEVNVAPSQTEKVTITNPTSETMTLFTLGIPQGISASFDHVRVEPHDKAVLTIQAGANAKGGLLILGITETKAMATLPVNVK